MQNYRPHGEREARPDPADQIPQIMHIICKIIEARRNSIRERLLSGRKEGKQGFAIELIPDTPISFCCPPP